MASLLPLLGSRLQGAPTLQKAADQTWERLAGAIAHLGDDAIVRYGLLI